MRKRFGVEFALVGLIAAVGMMALILTSVSWHEPTPGENPVALTDEHEAPPVGDDATDSLIADAADHDQDRSDDAGDASALPNDPDSITTPSVEPEPALDGVAGPKPEPQPEPAPDPEPEPQPEPAPDPEPEPQPEPAPDPEPEPQPEPAPDPEPESDVVIAANVGPEGASLVASSGEVRLEFPAGAYETTTLVTVRRVTPVGEPAGVLRLAGVYSIEPSGPLGAPVILSIRSALEVRQFQIARRLLEAAVLMTQDADGDPWLEGSVDTTITSGGYLQGSVSHFSYWTGASIQPHGTSPATTDYCSGVCHDLTATEGSDVRLAARDRQVCYFCHGNESADLGPAGATGSNVQAEFFECDGQTRPGTASTHPVSEGLACTNCHNPHGDPTVSPNLLRSYDAITGKAVYSGNEYCWTCHGRVSNRKINALVPGYYLASGGEKKTGFTGGEHGRGPSSTTRLDTAEELGQEILTRVLVNPAGFVELPQGDVVVPPAVTPTATSGSSSPYNFGPRGLTDGDATTMVYWTAAQAGATSGNGWIGTITTTFDLGSPTRVSSFNVKTYGYSSYAPDVIEVQTSDDGSSWSTLVSKGVTGIRLGIDETLTASDDCRYVRFIATREYTSGSGTVYLSDLSVTGRPSAGTIEARYDIARDVGYSSGSVAWSSSTPPSTGIQVEARASTNGGASWTAWQPVTNGGALTQIAQGANLSNALLDVRASLSTAVFGVTPTLDWLEITTVRQELSGETPAWEGGSSAPSECQRCHGAHGGDQSAMVLEGSPTVCTACHDTSLGGSYPGTDAYAESAHAAVGCTECHGFHGISSSPSGVYAFLLPDTRQDVCFSCHTQVQDGFNAALGSGQEWGKHDVYAVDQAISGSRIKCGSCHSPHAPGALVNPEDPTQPYVTYRDDPTSIPVEELTVYASKDTVLDSTVGKEAWNYGAASTVTLLPSNRLLLYFDLSGIPEGATIQHASLVLWTTSTPGGGYNVYPVTRDWEEGTGVGELNTAGINGATWFESRYGDNAWTGNTAAGDWTVQGGDLGALAVTNGAASGVTSVVVNDLVEQLLQGPNLGIMVTSNGGSTSFSTYLREYGTQTYRPKLRIYYQTGPATRQIVDINAYCRKCHDGAMPMGLTGQPMLNISAYETYRPHGDGIGPGPESRTHYSGAGAGLKPPYSYGMDAISCTDCHDPHGSALPFHLKEVINGRDMTSLSTWGYGNVIKGMMGMANVPNAGWFCGACHIYPTGHNREAGTGCAPCHGHSGTR